VFLKFLIFRENDRIFVYQSSRPDEGGNAIYDHYSQNLGIWRFYRAEQDLRIDFVSQIDYLEDDVEKALAVVEKDWLHERNTRFYEALRQNMNH